MTGRMANYLIGFFIGPVHPAPPFASDKYEVTHADIAIYQCLTERSRAPSAAD
jgi:hypothetical protein